MKKKVLKEITKDDLHRLEKARRTLLTDLSSKALLEIDGNTYFEELICVGYNPQLNQLEAVVSIKQDTGYRGGLCTDGSTEYVRFFIYWGAGSGFENVGLTSFRVHDISDLPPGPQHPLQYMVYLNLGDDICRRLCTTPFIPKVRAVLSFNKIPSLDPDARIYFGNRIDVDIQIEPVDFTVSSLLKEIAPGKDLSILDSLDINAAIPKLKPVPMPWSSLLSNYRKAKVPDHRLTYEAIYPMIKAGTNLHLSAAQKDLTLIKELKLDIDKITDALLEGQANITYEELICVGLNTASDILGAVIHVKKPYGYSGNLCQSGSKEYVSFWADWDNSGTYDFYLGTASVEVHDIANIPPEGLFYSVMLPANFSEHLKRCSNPNIIRIRAVLSWAVLPSTVDPDDLNYWGNFIDVVVQVRSGTMSTELMDLIYDVGNVPIENISPVTYLANPSSGALDPDICYRPAMDRPFGGNVRIGGRIYNTGAAGTVHYQVQYAQYGSSDWQPVTHYHRFELMHPNYFDPLYPKEVVQYHSEDGWFPYLEDPLDLPPTLERTSSLASWNTGSLEGVYKLRLAYTKDYPITPISIIHYSDEVIIILDNTGYTVSPTANAIVDTAYKLDLVIDGGDCHSYLKGNIIKGHLRALDQHFWKWVLELQPTTHTHGTKASPQCKSYSSLVDQGYEKEAWKLNTSNLDKCGYTLILWAYDRTIINSNGAIVHWEKKAVGFSVI
jgi:hypothetical protein